MEKKAKICIPVAAILAVLGGSWGFDFSQTTTTISDIDTTINEGDINVDISLDDLREICDSGIVPEKYQGACDLLDLLP